LQLVVLQNVVIPWETSPSSEWLPFSSHVFILFLYTEPVPQATFS
jgi:hypothetical protein